MQKVPRNLSLNRCFAHAWAHAFAALQGKRSALGLTLWLLFLTALMQPLHLAEEVHALLPATSQHHLALHPEEDQQLGCEKPAGDVSRPLDGGEHERHHQAQCSSDSEFSFSRVDAVSAAPQAWDITALDFVPLARAPRLEVPALPQRSRAPPQGKSPRLCDSFSPQSGRAPPVGI